MSRTSPEPATQSDEAFWAECALSALSHKNAKNAKAVKDARNRPAAPIGGDAASAGGARHRATAAAAAPPRPGLNRGSGIRDVKTKQAPKRAGRVRRAGLDATANVASGAGRDRVQRHFNMPWTAVSGSEKLSETPVCKKLGP